MRKNRASGVDYQFDDSKKSPDCTQLDRMLSVPMFVLSALFLLVLSALFHLTDGDLFSPMAQTLLVSLAVLYIAINAEAILHWRAGAKNLRRHVWYLIFPAFRMCPRDHLDGQHLWIPCLGWRRTTSSLEQYLSMVFSAPMIIIALLVLPVVGAEFFYADVIAANRWGWTVINIVSGFIWLAFVFEFVIMLSTVEKRIRYCRQNWIDIAVILLPLVSFMGAARLGRLLKLKQLTRTAKIYRIRGLALRAWRAVVALDVIDSLLRRDQETRMDNLRNKIEEREEEIAELRNRLERMESENRPKKFELSPPHMLKENPTDKGDSVIKMVAYDPHN